MTELIASTQQLIAEVTDERRKVNLMIKLIGLYHQVDLHKGIEVAEEACCLAEEIGYEVGVARAILGMGTCNTALGKYNEALEQLNRAQEELHRLGAKKFESTAFINISKIYSEMGNMYASLEHLYTGLKLAEESEYIAMQRVCLYNISMEYCRLNQIEKALETAQKSLALAMEHKDISAWVNALSQLGMIHTHYAKDRGKALVYFEEALHKSNEDPLQNKHYLATIQENLAIIYLDEGQYNEALVAASEALSLYKDWGNIDGGINPLLILAQIYIQIGKFDLGINFIRQGERVVQTRGHKQAFPDIHETYAHCYKKMGDYVKALEHYEKFHQLKEELFNEESQNKIHNLSILHDVERTKSEKELAEKEREIVRLKNVELSSALEEVRALNERLVQLDKEKNEVLGVVAHDLKSPLSGIRMVSSMLKEYHAKMPGEELTRQLETVEQTSDRMLGIVTNLLDVHAIESGMVYSKREDVDVVSVIESLVSGYREVAGRKRIELHTSYSTPTLSINGSREAVHQISENLLSNAIKFSPEGSRVYVSAEQVGEIIRMTVRDEGPGVSRKDREAMFEKYGRLSARPTGGESSTGLGLWIVKKAVESLGGAIRCESTTRKKGTTFVVEIPVLHIV